MDQNVLQQSILLRKDAKYFEIILDCIPNISNHEQMSLVIKYVADNV